MIFISRMLFVSSSVIFTSQTFGADRRLQACHPQVVSEAFKPAESNYRYTIKCTAQIAASKPMVTMATNAL